MLLCVAMAGKVVKNFIGGARLKEIRERSGVTQEQAAQAVGMSSYGYRKWEYGLAKPNSWEKVYILAGLFGVSPTVLVSEGEPSPVGLMRAA